MERSRPAQGPRRSLGSPGTLNPTELEPRKPRRNMLRRLVPIAIGAAALPLSAGCTIFGDGTFEVGPGVTQATAGTYESSGGAACTWQRTTGVPGAVIASGSLSGPDVVTILPSDSGFVSAGCGTWTPLPATGPVAASFGDGGYAVGIDIARGTFSAPGGPDCSWEQASDFLWSASSSIASGNPVGPVSVTLAPNAAAFEVQGCGTWSLDATPGVPNEA
jgi:hypothetical protein